MAAKIFMIPAQLGEGDIARAIPAYNLEIINQLTHYIVENERTARRQLIKMGIATAIDNLTFYILNKHTDITEIGDIFKQLGNVSAGVLSEAGAPGIADPGSDFIALAYKNGYQVVPLVGPSSIFLGLMASGMNGQQFCFNGYLPVKPHERKRSLKLLEKKIEQQAETQIFIETPYRNNQLLADILSACSPQYRLCIASMISTPQEFICTKPINEWQKTKPDLHKKPTVFLLGK